MKYSNAINIINDIYKLYKDGKISEEEYEATKENLKEHISPQTGTETRPKNIIICPVPQYVNMLIEQNDYKKEK